MTNRRETPRAPAFETILTKRVERLVRQFEAGALPREAWTHQAHVQAGLLYVLFSRASGPLAPGAFFYAGARFRRLR